MLNNFIAAKLHKRKCYKRIKPKAIKQAYLGLFLALSWNLCHCHSIHQASGETRRIFWWKYRMGFMRGRIIITVCAVTSCDMIGIVNFVCKSSVTVCFFALWILMPFSDFVLYVQMSHSNTFWSFDFSQEICWLVSDAFAWMSDDESLVFVSHTEVSHSLCFSASRFSF